MGSHLATYLNDHLAGATAALELLEHLESAHAGTPIAPFASALRLDIAADRAELQHIMARVHVGESFTRKTTAWLSAKMTDLKLRVDDPSNGPLSLLESLEILSLGIEGKRLLWLALDAVSATTPALKDTDYALLTHRAEEQRQRIEPLRQEASRSALP